MRTPKNTQLTSKFAWIDNRFFFHLLILVVWPLPPPPPPPITSVPFIELSKITHPSKHSDVELSNLFHYCYGWPFLLSFAILFRVDEPIFVFRFFFCFFFLENAQSFLTEKFELCYAWVWRLIFVRFNMRFSLFSFACSRLVFVHCLHFVFFIEEQNKK